MAVARGGIGATIVDRIRIEAVASIVTGRGAGADRAGGESRARPFAGR